MDKIDKMRLLNELIYSSLDAVYVVALIIIIASMYIGSISLLLSIILFVMAVTVKGVFTYTLKHYMEAKDE